MRGWDNECKLKYGHHGEFKEDRDYEGCIIKIFHNSGNFKGLIFNPALDAVKVLSTSYLKEDYLVEDAQKIIDSFTKELDSLLGKKIESPLFTNIKGYKLEENNTEELVYNVKFKEMIMGHRESDSEIVRIKKDDLKSLFLK